MRLAISLLAFSLSCYAAEPRWSAGRMLGELLGPLAPQSIFRALLGGNGGAPPAGPITFVAGSNCAASANGNNATTSAQNNTGADTLFVGVIDYAAVSLGTVTSSPANTWTCRTSYSDIGSGAARATICYAKAATVSGTQTFTYTASGSFPAICSLSVANLSSSAPYDAENGNTGSSNPLASGSVTPSVADNLVITVAGASNNNFSSVASPFTTSGTVGYTGASLSAAMGYVIQSAASARNASWTNAGTFGAASIAVFKQ